MSPQEMLKGAPAAKQVCRAVQQTHCQTVCAGSDASFHVCIHHARGGSPGAAPPLQNALIYRPRSNPSQCESAGQGGPVIAGSGSTLRKACNDAQHTMLRQHSPAALTPQASKLVQLQGEACKGNTRRHVLVSTRYCQCHVAVRDKEAVVTAHHPVAAGAMWLVGPLPQVYVQVHLQAAYVSLPDDVENCAGGHHF